MRISDWSSDVCSSDLGFIGKLALFRATIEAGYAWLAVVAVANTVASLFYYLRVVGPMYLRPAEVRAVGLGPWTTTATWRSEERRVGRERDSTCRSRWLSNR